MREQTEIVIQEDGSETHESWVRLTTSKPSSTPGARLFDSEIRHQHFISVKVERTERRRDLKRDWFYNTKILMKLEMSQAQWGAFVSSFGDGGGVPATLRYLTGVGHVPEAVPTESRLQVSAREVREAGDGAVEGIQLAYAELQAAFDSGAGKKEVRELLRNLKFKIAAGPANMEFAAKSLTEHVENVITKARADIEGMAASGLLASGDETAAALLGPGEDE